MNLSSILAPIVYVLKFHRKTMLVGFAAALLFAWLIFPFGDLADFLTSRIAKSTQNQIFVQTEDLDIAFLPPSLEMTQVTVDSPMLPTLKMDVLNLAPSVAGLLAFRPGFSVGVRGLWDGVASLVYQTGKKAQNDVQLLSVELDARRLNLGKLTDFLMLPLDLEGAAGMEIDGEFDQTFTQQPASDFSIEAEPLRLPPQTIPTQFGPFSLPNIQFKQLRIKGRLADEQLTIEEGTFGDAKDPIRAVIFGQAALRLDKTGPNVSPRIGAYEATIDLTLDRKTEKDLQTYLSFFDKYKTLTGTGARYHFTIKAPNPYSAFSLSAPRAKSR